MSNNWNISHRESETVLLEWIEKNKSKALSKEFLIRGVDNSGNGVITVRKIHAQNEKKKCSKMRIHARITSEWMISRCVFFIKRVFIWSGCLRRTIFYLKIVWNVAVNKNRKFFLKNQVLAEEKLDFVQKKFEKFCSSLYSIELASKSNAKRLNATKINDSKWWGDFRF